MRRFLPVAIVMFLLCAPVWAAEQQAPTPPPITSVIYAATDSFALNQFEENPAVTRRMVDALVMAATQQPDVARAWRSLVAPTDRVGIKVCATGGRYFGSHRGIVDAIAAGLEESGVPANRIIVWDRDGADLQAAGFVTTKAGYQVRSIAPFSGYDREVPVTAPVLGRLIWGDLAFKDAKVRAGKRLPVGEELSSTSYVANILSKEVTKVINVPVLSDEGGCGVAGAIYNMTVPNLDNWRRFTQEGGGDALPDVYADEHFGPKVVLTIMDALRPQYASGPRFNPNYGFAWSTIYASKDPVALDSHALRLLEGWRKDAKLPAIGRRGAWLEDASRIGLGNFAENRILLRPVESR